MYVPRYMYTVYKYTVNQLVFGTLFCGMFERNKYMTTTFCN